MLGNSQRPRAPSQRVQPLQSEGETDELPPSLNLHAPIPVPKPERLKGTHNFLRASCGGAPAPVPVPGLVYCSHDHTLRMHRPTTAEEPASTREAAQGSEAITLRQGTGGEWLPSQGTSHRGHRGWTGVWHTNPQQVCLEEGQAAPISSEAQKCLLATPGDPRPAGPTDQPLLCTAARGYRTMSSPFYLFLQNLTHYPPQKRHLKLLCNIM